MAITLDQFRTISNGTHNVGQIMLNEDGNGLQKINNHVWKTGQNNVQTDVNANKAVRQALFDAFSSSGIQGPMLNDIKTILLGGTNGSRSLSRDFVKKLFDTVDHAHEGDDIVSMMNVVSKSLSVREIHVAKNNLVTSSRSAAYTIYSNEKMDVYASWLQDSFNMMSRNFVGGGNQHDNILADLTMIASNLTKMVTVDKRVAGRINEQEVMDRFNDIRLYAENVDTNAASEDAKELFVRSVKEEIQRAYNDLGLQDVMNDHLSRVFPPEDENVPPAPEQAVENQENQLNVQGDNDIQPAGDNDIQPAGDNNIQPAGDNNIQPVFNDFNKGQSEEVKNWFTKIASTKDFNKFANEVENGPHQFYYDISELIGGSKVISSLSAPVQDLLSQRLQGLYTDHVGEEWSNYQNSEPSALGKIRTDLFAELDNVFYGIDETLSVEDKNMLAATFNCEPDEAAGKLSKYFQDELDKLGINQGANE